MKTKIFLSGPISADIHRNRRRFHRWAKRLTRRGYAVLNPATLPLGMEYEDYMDICSKMIDKSDGLFFLKGWPDSPGACREHDYAVAKGLPIFYEEDWK